LFIQLLVAKGQSFPPKTLSSLSSTQIVDLLFSLLSFSIKDLHRRLMGWRVKRWWASFFSDGVRCGLVQAHCLTVALLHGGLKIGSFVLLVMDNSGLVLVFTVWRFVIVPPASSGSWVFESVGFTTLRRG